MQKILITGASGFLGWNLCQIAQTEWDVYGTYHQHSIEISGVNIDRLDLTDFELVRDKIDQIAPDAIVHTAAASKPNFCQANPDRSYQINVSAAQLLATICAEARIPFVFTSTDLVFDGTNAPYLETDPVSPINIYGEQKVAAECHILTVYPQATICRMPLMFGMAPSTASSFLQQWIKAFYVREKLELFIDEFRTPVSAVTASKGLLLMLQASTSGIINLGGKERISRYDFGRLLAEVFEFDLSLVSPISQRDLVMAAPRAADVSLDSTKAIELGYNLPSLRSELELIKQMTKLDELI